MSFASFLPGGHSAAEAARIALWLGVAIVLLPIVIAFLPAHKYRLTRALSVFLALIGLAALFYNARASAPRHLTPDQYAELVGTLKPFPGHKLTIKYPPNDKEAEDFGEDFEKAFRDAGWQIDIRYVMTVRPTLTGVRIKGQAQTNAETSTPLQAVIDGVKGLKLSPSPEVVFDKDVPPGIVELWIGAKPLASSPGS